MGKYRYLAPEDREQIAIMCAAGWANGAIATSIGKSSAPTRNCPPCDTILPPPASDPKVDCPHTNAEILAFVTRIFELGPI